jgi:glycine cleavage system regulatory protein
MKSYLVVTITCPDRPGIVERITNVIVAHQGNWEESRMAHLGGEFAGIVLLSVADEQVEALSASLQALSDQQTTVVVRPTQLISGEQPPERSRIQLRLSGADHEGIVHDVAAYLAHRGINVETMETEVVHAPITATPLFEMKAELSLPGEVKLEDLQANLDHLAEELSVDIEVDGGDR